MLTSGAALFAASEWGGHRVLGALIVIAGALCLVWALARGGRDVQDSLRRTRGAPAWLARPMSALPAPAAKMLFCALSVAIVVLGVIDFFAR